MKRTLRIVAVGDRVWVLSPLLLAGFSAVFYLAATDSWHPLSVGVAILAGIEYIVVVLSSATILLYCLRLRGRSAVVDADGVGAEFRGERLWTLPWSRYGGYRLRKLRPIESILHPERSGIDVLDRDGKPVGVLHVNPNRSSGPGGTPNTNYAVCRAFFRALDEHATIPQPTPRERVQARRPPVVVSWLMALCGTLGGAALLPLVFAANAALRDGTDQGGLAEAPPVSQVYWMGGLLILSAIVGSLGWLSIVARCRPDWLADKPHERLPDPEEGPHIEDRAVDLEQGEANLDYQDGVRYRYVHPEARANQLRAEASMYRLLQALIGAMCALMALMFLGDPKNAKDGWSILLFVASIAALAEIPRRWTLSRTQWLNDTIIPQDGELIVVSPEGRARRFVAKRLKRTMLLHDRQGLYWLDRAELFASDVSLDHEELRDRPHLTA